MICRSLSGGREEREHGGALKILLDAGGHLLLEHLSVMVSEELNLSSCKDYGTSFKAHVRGFKRLTWIKFLPEHFLHE